VSEVRECCIIFSTLLEIRLNKGHNVLHTLKFNALVLVGQLAYSFSKLEYNIYNNRIRVQHVHFCFLLLDSEINIHDNQTTLCLCANDAREN